MAIFKCKMCGGDLELSEGMTVAECEYCGSLQTVPSADNEKKMTLFSRANRLRAGCEFDKAAGVYETIVADFPEEAEAYWGLLLCRYGIEYVDDPATGKKIPTCHRSSFDSVMEDSDFEQACENADAYARRVYRDEAKAIEELRKGIIAVSANEQPYDIFICYKETADDGERTLDSVLAQDIYDALTGKGYRVFFSRVTLEDKLGVEYEPYIFAALNSAKIMLAVGTDYEYYNAVWVKNEWSRFLKLMAADKSKYLIPCFKGLDAYDMPKEFAKLQAQDMGKVGAMQDLLRGIDKIMGKSEASSAPVAAPVAAPAPAANATVDSLLKRAQMFLEDKNWDRATEYAEKVLDIDPECADAYMVLLLATWRIRMWEEAGAKIIKLVQSREYKRARQFASGALADKLADAKRLANEYAERLAQVEKQRQEEAKRRKEEEAHRKEEEAHRKKEEWLRRKEEEARRKKELQEKLPAYYHCHTPSMVVCTHRSRFGLREDGTVVACGENDEGECDVSGWKDIVAVVAGGVHTVGLKSNGTVVACGRKGDGQCNVSGWTDIVAVAAGLNHTVGLKSDGTVVTCGDNWKGQCDVSDWTDIVAIAATDYNTVGLKSNGTVVACGDNRKGQCDVSGWTDIVAIAVESSTIPRHTVGLKANGTVVACGENAFSQCDVSGWEDIVAVVAGGVHTVGLKSNGTVVACGLDGNRACSVSGWTDIVAIAAGEEHTVGLKSDGTVVACGSDADRECSVFGWTDIVAIAAGQRYTVGLKSNGTVVICGKYVYGQNDISNWKLFDSFDDVVNRVVAEEERRKAKEEQRKAKEEQRKVAAKKREAEQKAEQEKRKAAAEKKRLKRITALEMEKQQIETELPHIKGLFSGKRRKEIETRLAEIEKELKGLSVDEK